MYTYLHIDERGGEYIEIGKYTATPGHLHTIKGRKYMARRVALDNGRHVVFFPKDWTQEQSQEAYTNYVAYHRKLNAQYPTIETVSANEPRNFGFAFIVFVLFVILFSFVRYNPSESRTTDYSPERKKELKCQMLSCRSLIDPSANEDCDSNVSDLSGYTHPCPAP